MQHSDFQYIFRNFNVHSSSFEWRFCAETQWHFLSHPNTHKITYSYTHLLMQTSHDQQLTLWEVWRDTHTHTHWWMHKTVHVFFFFLINIPICVHMFKGRVNRQIHSQKWVYSETFCLHLPWPYVRLHGLLMGDI